MAAYNIKIDTLQVKDGQVVAIGLSGGAKELMALAVGEVEMAQKYIDHMQRPLARKFTSQWQ